LVGIFEIHHSVIFGQSVIYPKALTVEKNMTRSKNWQCPYCEYETSRRWNAVGHIRVIHRVVDQPIDKRNSRKGRNTSFSNLDGTHIDRRPSPSPYILIVVL
jgi:hypothetical protein